MRNRDWEKQVEMENCSKRIVVHIYLRARDKGVIFYDDVDRLVYFSVIASQAKKYGITVLAAAIMFTHVHISAMAASREQIDRFIQESSSEFARLYNIDKGRSGRFFAHHPGKALKKTSKLIRTNIIYVFNNHVEKRLCVHAIEERWSFLAYGRSKWPFSVKPERHSEWPFSGQPEQHGAAMKKAMAMVRRRAIKRKPLKHSELRRMLSLLSEDERERLKDHIITSYALVDFDAASSFFNGFEAMVTAIDSSAGSEWDIKEEFCGEDDRAYLRLMEWAKKNKICDNNGAFNPYALDNATKAKLTNRLLRTTDISLFQIRKFLHFFSKKPTD